MTAPIGPRAVPPRGAPLPCPAADELARFVDGVMPDDARARITVHLVGCDDCREIVAMAADATAVEVPVPVTSTAEPGRRVRIGAAMAVAASLVFAVYLWRPAAPPPLTDSVEPWAAIDAAMGSTRPVEGRLSLVTRHVPFAGPSRTSAGGGVSFSAQAVAARLSDQAAAAAPAARREAEHAAGVAWLVAGRPGDAVARLDRVLNDGPGSAMLFTDQSAAHLALAAIESPVHWTAALEAADRALRLAPDLPSARFNRALALEGLGRVDDARIAWQAVAGNAADDQAWRDEAVRHLQRLSR